MAGFSQNGNGGTAGGEGAESPYFSSQPSSQGSSSGNYSMIPRPGTPRHTFSSSQELSLIRRPFGIFSAVPSSQGSSNFQEERKTTTDHNMAPKHFHYSNVDTVRQTTNGNSVSIINVFPAGASGKYEIDLNIRGRIELNGESFSIDGGSSTSSGINGTQRK